MNRYIEPHSYFFKIISNKMEFSRIGSLFSENWENTSQMIVDELTRNKYCDFFYSNNDVVYQIQFYLNVCPQGIYDEIINVMDVELRVQDFLLHFQSTEVGKEIRIGIVGAEKKLIEGNVYLELDVNLQRMN